MNRLFICDVLFNNITHNEFISEISHFNLSTNFIVTPNVDFIVRASNDYEFKRIINESDISICDSAIVYYSSFLFKYKLKAKITGDLATKAILTLASKEKKKIFLLGSTDEVLQNVKRRIEKEYSGIEVSGYYNGYFDLKESKNIINIINNSGASFLLVGMGSPLQEKWCSKNKSQLNVDFIICIGGLFNIYSGLIKRAPNLLQNIGLEWLWRLVNEPSRLWRRYLIEDMKYLKIMDRF